MTNLDLLIPFGLLPAEMSTDLLRELKMPSLAMLLGRSRSVSESDLDAFSRALPHEAWLARRFGLADKSDATSPPLANPLMHALGVPRESGYWFILQPAHLHVARDHLVLTDPRKLSLTDEESRRLFESVKPLVEETGKSLIYGNARTWFLRADEWIDLQTSTPEAANGHNIDIWMPQGPSARDWRKLLNELQMHWHMHPLNAEREARGLQSVNSLWLWGGAVACPEPVQSPYQQVFNAPTWLRKPDFSQADNGADVTAILDHSGSNNLVILDELMDPALATDWSAWLENMHRLEKDWFSALLEHLRNGKIEQATLIFSHGTKLLEIASGKNSLKKFWVKPSLKALSR